MNSRRLIEAIEKLTLSKRRMKIQGMDAYARYAANDVYLISDPDQEVVADIVEGVRRGPIWYIEGEGSFTDINDERLNHEVWSREAMVSQNYNLDDEYQLELFEERYPSYPDLTVEELMESPDDWGDWFWYSPSVIQLWGSFSGWWVEHGAK